MKLSFGRYRGQEIGDVPSHYLTWLLNPRLRKSGETFAVPFEVQQEAQRMLRLRGMDLPLTELPTDTVVEMLRLAIGVIEQVRQLISSLPQEHAITLAAVVNDYDQRVAELTKPKEMIEDASKV